MRILKWSISIILGLVILLLALVYFLPGYELSVVRSDSMAPVFTTGDLVITAPPGSFLVGGVQTGSIIAFETGNERITHRVISVGQGAVITKGDANEEPDTWLVAMSQVKGIYLMKIPFVGHFNAFVHTKMGWFLFVIVPGALLIGLIVKDIIKEALRSDKKSRVTAGEDKPLTPSSDVENGQRTA